MAHSTHIDLVGPVEIATILDVQLPTVYRWRTRKTLPVPRWTVSGSPIWLREEIVAWAAATGRLPVTVQAA
jgi:predicted DNA-binding transcriptional regulator AlpA